MHTATFLKLSDVNISVFYIILHILFVCPVFNLKIINI